jgi:diguanylate cyclase (GGDEF)-like protein
MAEEPKARQELEFLREELSARESEIALLLETSQAIGSELDLDKVFATIAERARLLIKADTVLVVLLSDDKSAYTYRAGTGLNAEEIVGQTLPIEFGLCGWVLRNQRPWWRGTLSELNVEERNRWEHEAGTVLLVPLVGRRNFLGGLSGINKQGGGDFSQRDLTLLQLFAAQAAIAIENAMAMNKVELARRDAEYHQIELQRLNKRLNAANRQLEQLSLFDALTGLPNRTLFRDRVHHEIEVAAATRAHVAILLIDLDKFQDINNSFGQETGDALLKAVAAMLEGTLKTGSTLSRISGDEFAALLCDADTDADAAVALGRTMNEKLAAGVTADGHTIPVAASIGIAVYPGHGDNLSILMKSADLAMNCAKSEHSGVHVFDPAHDSGRESRFELTQNLRDALDREEFTLYYQPKLDLDSGRITGCEALARWPHPQRGLVPPEMFISALEQTSLILPFTRWAIRTALRQQQAWRRMGWELDIAVNVPPVVLMNPEFLDLLAADTPAAGLTLEITENLFLGDLERLAAVVARIRELGFTLSIDDFGTGYSSLQRLRQTAVSEIKIDRSFIMGMLDNKDDAVIVHSTIELAHNLGLRVVGEGVEHAEILAQLKSLGCDSVQGYHICRPMPPAMLEEFMTGSAWPAQQLTSVQARA